MVRYQVTCLHVDQKQADDWTDEWEGKMRELLDIVYNNYPTAIKLFQPTYGSDWQPQAWYNLIKRGSSSRLYRRSNGSTALGSGETGRVSEWQFNPAVEQGLVGLYGRDGNRLKLDSYFAGGMTGHLEEMTRGVNVVYKMIPFINVSEFVVQLAGPFKESDRYKYDCRANKNSGVIVPFQDWVLKKV